jgi:hypothetical protein
VIATGNDQSALDYDDSKIATGNNDSKKFTYDDSNGNDDDDSKGNDDDDDNNSKKSTGNDRNDIENSQKQENGGENTKTVEASKIINPTASIKGQVTVTQDYDATNVTAEDSDVKDEGSDVKDDGKDVSDVKAGGGDTTDKVKDDKQSILSSATSDHLAMLVLAIIVF